jgi:hypothetical protein
MMQLSLRSRTTSISNSFQPITDSSISSSRVGDGFDAALADRDELLAVVGDAAAGAAERERRPDHDGEAESGLHLQRFLQRMRKRRARPREADAAHRLLELLAVLGLVDRLARGADQLDSEFLEHALARKVERAVQRRLAAHRRQQRIRALALDDARHRLPRDRLDVGRVRHLRVGHDRRRVRIHQHDAIALGLQRLACLRAGIVELARLPDHDRAGADDQDRLEVSPFWHRSSAPLKRSNRYEMSCGPGLASGCPWKQNAGRSVRASPCSDPSNSDTCVGRKLAGRPLRIDREAVVLARDHDAPVSRSLTGMVRAVVAEFHLQRLRARREAHQLVPEADAEHRDLRRVEQLADRLDRVVARLRGRPGPLERKMPVGLRRNASRAGVCAGTIVSRAARSASRRRMLRLTP